MKGFIMKKLRIASALMITIALLLSLTTVAFAEVTPQQPPNYTFADAQLMLRNAITPTQYQNADNSQQHVISGSLTSGSDENWYYLYLPADPSGNNTFLSINCQYLTADVYDSNQNILFSRTYIKSTVHLGARSYRVPIDTAGYYYIRLYGLVGSDGDYLMTMGGPNYAGGHIDFTAPAALTISSGTTTAQAMYDLSDIAVEQDAIAYLVTINGTKTGSCTSESRSLKYANEANFMSSSSYTWQVNIALSLSKRVANNWTVKVSGNPSSSGYSLTPKLTFWYVYPLYPECF
jgi:hypothetical protein